MALTRERVIQISEGYEPDFHESEELARHWLATHEDEARTACGDEASVANEESRT